VAACAALGGVRPYYGPVPGSIGAVLSATPDVVTRAAAEEVRRAGLAIQTVSAAEGYVETQWFDIRARTSSPRSDIGALDHGVKLRFFADPTAEHTRLAAEAVAAYAVDPSRPAREMERMVPEGSPGMVVLTQILGRLKARFPLADGTAAPK
jgi:hypothetical protein